MAEPSVRVETRTPVSGDGRQISSSRRYGVAEFADRESDLQAAIQSVLGAMGRAVTDAPGNGLQVGELEVSFNVAFAPEQGAYLCSASAEATFAVKLSMTLADTPGPGGSPGA
jgi:hypothetical protein